MDGVQPETIACPYCGEEIEVLVDCSAGQQEYVEDCSVCCRPILLHIEVEDGDVVAVDARAENE
jgi:hypothetical protein